MSGTDSSVLPRDEGVTGNGIMNNALGEAYEQGGEHHHRGKTTSAEQRQGETVGRGIGV